MHGCIRPGCVFLTLDIGLRLDERRAATAAGALSLLDHLTKWCSCWRELRVALQVGNSLAISVVRCPLTPNHSILAPLRAAHVRLSARWVSVCDRWGCCVGR